MNAAEFMAWCRQRGFRCPKNAAEALGLPETQVSGLDASDDRGSARLALACIAYEYCDGHHPPEREMSGHYASIRQRIRRFLELEPGPRDKDLAAALVLGLASVVGLEKGEWGKNEILGRAHDLISRSPEWSRVAGRPGPISAKLAAAGVQQQKKERKTEPETLRRYDCDQEKEKMENKIIGVAAPLGGELIFLPPPHVAKRDDSQITRGNNNDGGATVTAITWCNQSRYGTAQRVNALPAAATILPLEDETDVGGAAHAVPACDWSWSICLTCEVLQKAIAERSGIFLVTSEARTVFAHRLAMTLRAADCIVGFDRRPAASLESPLAALSARLGIKFDGGNRAAWCQRLAEALERQPSATPVLLIDTADLLGDSSIRELATVLDAGGDGAKIRAVLVGRPELQKRLEQPDLATVNARVRFRCRLEPLDEMDVRSIIARRLPHDFAIGAIAPGRLTAIGDYIRANPDALAFLWGRSRRLARDSDEPVPSLVYVAKAAQMLSGSADGLGSAMAHGDAPPNSGNAELRGSRNAVGRKALPRAMVRIATVALIVAVWSVTPSFDGREHPALTGAARERLAAQSVLAIGQDVRAYRPAPSLQMAMVDDSSDRHDDKDTTTTALNPASHSQPPPTRPATPSTSTTRPERRAHGNDRALTHAVPTARRSNDRPLPARSIKPLPPERPAQTDGQSPSQIAAVPTVPRPPAQTPPARNDTQLVAASVPTCQPYLSQVDFSGHAARVTGLACHDATGRWWLVSQQQASK